MAWWDDLFKPQAGAQLNQKAFDTMQNPGAQSLYKKITGNEYLGMTPTGSGGYNTIQTPAALRAPTPKPPTLPTPRPPTPISNVQATRNQLSQFQNYNQPAAYRPPTPMMNQPIVEQPSWLQNIFQPQQPAQLSQQAVNTMQQPGAQDLYQQITGEEYGGAEQTAQGGFNAVPVAKQAQVTPNWQGMGDWFAGLTKPGGGLYVPPGGSNTPGFNTSGNPTGGPESWLMAAQSLPGIGGVRSFGSSNLSSGRLLWEAMTDAQKAAQLGSQGKDLLALAGKAEPTVAAAGQVPGWLSGAGNWLKSSSMGPTNLPNWAKLAVPTGLAGAGAVNSIGGGFPDWFGVGAAETAKTAADKTASDKAAADKAAADLAAQQAADKAILDAARNNTGGQGASGLQISPDGRFFWNGSEWRQISGGGGAEGQGGTNAAQVARDRMAEIMAQTQSNERIAQMNNQAQAAQTAQQNELMRQRELAASTQNMANMYAADPYKYWAQMGQLTPEAVAALTGGEVAPGEKFSGVPLSHPSMQWWNNLLPSEQEQILGALNWMGVSPEDWFEMQQRMMPGLASRQITPSYGR